MEKSESQNRREKAKKFKECQDTIEREKEKYDDLPIPKDLIDKEAKRAFENAFEKHYSLEYETNFSTTLTTYLNSYLKNEYFEYRCRSIGIKIPFHKYTIIISEARYLKEKKGRLPTAKEVADKVDEFSVKEETVVIVEQIYGKEIIGEYSPSHVCLKCHYKGDNGIWKGEVVLKDGKEISIKGEVSFSREEDHWDLDNFLQQQEEKTGKNIIAFSGEAYCPKCGSENYYPQNNPEG